MDKVTWTMCDSLEQDTIPTGRTLILRFSPQVEEEWHTMAARCFALALIESSFLRGILLPKPTCYSHMEMVPLLSSAVRLI